MYYCCDNNDSLRLNNCLNNLLTRATSSIFLQLEIWYFILVILTVAEKV